ncbi:hypothetical protein IKG07_02910 [Candidatus Saccharibacteria bacterium]|nr:hypothetical protein [Candidatus Saccharibacteria bacterium]
MAADNDPYNDMLDSEKKDIRPGFLGGNGDGESKGKQLLNAAEQAAMLVASKGGSGGSAGASAAAGGTKSAAGAKNAVSEGLKSGAEKAEAGEKKPGFYKGDRGSKSGANGDDEDGPSFKMSGGMKIALAVMGPILLLLIALIAIITLIVSLPIMMIGALDFNLMRVLGFTETVGILEEQGEHVTAEFAKNGKMPNKYFNDLVANGIDVGQVTANGDFIRTDTYIANIEDRDDLIASASGFSYISEDEGELAMLWNGKVITADDFVAAVESDPNLYAAYSTAADISTKYYYGEDVENVYKDMGLSRGNFNDFDVTGNYSEDDARFYEILNDALDFGSDVVVGGAYDDRKDNPDGEIMIEDLEDKSSPCETGSDGGTYCRDVSNMETAEMSGQVSENTKEYIIRWEWGINEDTGLPEWKPVYSENSTKRAAELLNTAVSSSEPYLASNAFIVVEESIQRARVDGNGPVNHVMNALTRGKEVSYQNVETGGIETTNRSILETKNFRAVVSDSKYDKEEAQNFGRDRVLKTTEQADTDIIKKTTVGTGGKESSNSVVRNGKTGGEAEADIVAKANENVELSKANYNSENFQSVIGGNRIIEGGSMLSNTINMHVIGAMPSDAGKIAEYHQEVEKVMARKAEAERASKSPFDISSPYTFLGSIVHNISTSVLGNYGSSLNSVVNSIGATTGKAMAGLTGSAVADSYDKEFSTMSGIGCETVGSAGAIEGDLYCTSHNTVSTEYMANTQEDWDEAVSEEEYEEFVKLAMDRYSSVGTKDADVCERYHEIYDNGIFDAIGNFFKNMFGTYEVCKIEVDDYDEILESEKEKLAYFTGAAYSFGSEAIDAEKNELLSGYALYTEVKSLLTEEESETAKIRNAYYATHPKDYSRAGIISRRSGMTKGEAEIALAYADYLNEIANYDPSTRRMGAPVISFEKPILEYHSDEVALQLYAWYSKQAEYDDLRTRNFVV